MNNSKIRKTAAISGVLLFLTLAMCSASAAQTQETSIIDYSSVLRKDNPGGGPWWSSRNVEIDYATVYVFQDPFFELYSFISNHGNWDVTVIITHVLQKPDGTKEQVSWDQLTLHRGQGVEYWIMCAFLDEQYGKYSYIVTVSNMNGYVLDQQTITWERTVP